MVSMSLLFHSHPQYVFQGKFAGKGKKERERGREGEREREGMKSQYLSSSHRDCQQRVRDGDRDQNRLGDRRGG